MLSTYFKRNTTLSEFYKSPAGLYLDEFTDWLSDRGFHTETIRRRIQGTVHFNDWIHVNNIKMENLAPDVMVSYRQYLKKRGQFSTPDKLIEMLRVSN